MDCLNFCNTVFKHVDDLPSLTEATRNHAYIAPDNKIYILNADGTGYMQMSTDGGGVTVGLSSKDGSITIVETKDSVTHTFDISVSEDIINRITALENKPDKDTIYDDSVLEAKINDILDKIANLGSSNGGSYTAGAGITITDDGVISLVDPTDNDTTYTAGNGLILAGTQFAVNHTTDLVVTNGKLGIKPNYVQENFYVNGTTLVKERADGNKVQLDFTELINHIDRGDNDTFVRTQYVSSENLYIPASVQGDTHVFNLTSYPVTNKLVSGHLVLTISSFVGKGTKISNGVSTQTTLNSGLPTSFHIPVFNDNTMYKHFCETIRIDYLDIELELSGFMSIISPELRLKDVKLCIVTGKVHNSVEYKYVDFINNLASHTRTLNGFNYEFRLTHVPKIEFWGLNIVR